MSMPREEKIKKMNNNMERISNLFNEERVLERFKPNGKKANNERGDLLKELSNLTSYPLGRILAKTAHLKNIKDYYYLLSVIKDDVRTGRKSSHKHALNSSLFMEK